MDSELKARLQVVGEMAESFFPHGFCSEVLSLADQISDREAAEVLATYDFFLQTQQKYQATAHQVYQDLAGSLRGQDRRREEWRLDFLVDNARQPYDEEAIAQLRRAVAECVAKPLDHYSNEDLRRLMDAVGVLSFYMTDSPAYPSERPLKFYQFLYSGGKLRNVSYTSILRRVLRHADTFFAEHRALEKSTRQAVA